jgi:CheY-like chemotaxis protein
VFTAESHTRYQFDRYRPTSLEHHAFEFDNLKEEARPTPMGPNDRLGNLRILVVDDDTDTREMLCFIFQQAGGHAVAVGSVAEAFESYKRSPPDVIVSDIGMPGYNGYALIALIRAHDKELGRTTPVIALTAYTSPADEKTAMAAGFQKYLSKPFDPEEIIEAIRAQIPLKPEAE